MKITKILTTTVIMMLVLLFLYVPIGNDLIALNVSKKLRNTPLPKNTKLIDYTSEARKLVGNGNGMQYLGIILLKSGLTLGELDNYYSQYRENDWSFLVSEQQSSQIEFIEHGSLEFDSLKKIKNFSGYYIVYSYGDSDNPLFDLDLRGH